MFGPVSIVTNIVKFLTLSKFTQPDGTTFTSLNLWKTLSFIFALAMGIGWIIWEIQVSLLNSEIKDLTIENNVLTERLTAEQSKSSALAAGKSLIEHELSSQGVLLESCYKSVSDVKRDLDLIDQNMADGKDGAPLNITEEGEFTYERVTQEQNTAGIEYLNNLFTIVK